MNPLPVTGCSGKPVDHRLIDRDPLADAEHVADPFRKLVEPICVSGLHIGSDLGYFEPLKSVFEVVKNLDPHASIYCNGFPESHRIKHGLVKNIGELRNTSRPTLCRLPGNSVGREFAIQESLYGFGISRHLSPVDKNLVYVIPVNSVQHLKKTPLSFYQQELTGGDCTENSLFGMGLQSYGHAMFRHAYLGRLL